MRIAGKTSTGISFNSRDNIVDAKPARLAARLNIITGSFPSSNGSPDETEALDVVLPSRCATNSKQSKRSLDGIDVDASVCSTPCSTSLAGIFMDSL